MANLSGAGAPTKHTVGAVKDVYTNTNNGKQYVCASVVSIQTDKENITLYEWDLIIPDTSDIPGDGSTGEDETRTYLLVDEDGNEYPAVLVDEKTIFTATANDIRLGTVAATDTGVTPGEKIIPAYHTFEGYRLIPAGSVVIIPNVKPDVDSYDYTKLQAMICLFNISEPNSVSTEKVSIGDRVYEVRSTEPLTDVTKNHESKIVNFGITNDSSTIWILRYFMYKEII